MTRRFDDDTDPDGSSQSGRFPIVSPEEGALSSQSRGAWSLVLFVSAVLTGTGAVGGASYALAAVAADRRVAPVEKRIDDHELALAGKRQIMDLKTTQFETALERIERKLDRVCAASARPQVCLGADQ
jgi:type II secretory pathway predicted ATPase ExeA